MELAVVVVLDDPGIVALGPVHQRQAAVQRQRRPGRELVRWREEHCPCTRRQLRQPLHLHALGIDRHRHRPQPRRIEGTRRAVVHRVLDQDALTGIEQHVGTQRQRLLRAGQHQHPFRRGVATTFEVDVVGDRPAQCLHALRRAVRQHRAALRADHLALQAFPGLQGEVPRLRHAGREGMLRGAGDPAGGAQRLAARAQPHDLPRRVATPLRLAAGKWPGTLRHPTAAAHLAFDEALGMQLAVGRLDRIAGYPQRLRQRARGRQGAAHFQRTVQDQLADRPLDTGMQRQPGMGGVADAGLHRLQLRVPEHRCGDLPGCRNGLPGRP